MKISFDPAKNARNILELDLSFDRVVDLNWADTVVVEDERNRYPERRFVGAGYLDGRLHILCFTPLPDGIRVISFRKANLRESRRYGKAITVTSD